MTPESTAELNRLHDRAMELVQLAHATSAPAAARLLFFAALDHERRVASELFCTNFEPSRSIIFRSAASIAIDCGELDEAERLAAQGLGGNPARDVAKQLREIIWEVSLRRNIDCRFAPTSANRIHVTFAGPHASPNSIDPTLFSKHMESLHAMMFRVYENILGSSFRTQASIRTRDFHKDFITRYEPASNGVFGYNLSVQRLQLQFNWQDENNRPSSSDNIVEATKDVIRWVADGKRGQLLDFCKDNRDYYRYFVNETRCLLPDGKRISRVGFSTDDQMSGEVIVSPATREMIKRKLVYIAEHSNTERFAVRGSLDRAFRASSTIAIKRTEDAQVFTFQVPDGITAELLGRLWDSEVVAYASSREGQSHPTLESIESAIDSELDD